MTGDGTNYARLDDPHWIDKEKTYAKGKGRSAAKGSRKGHDKPGKGDGRHLGRLASQQRAEQQRHGRAAFQVRSIAAQGVIKVVPG